MVKLEHVGIKVRDMDKSLEFYSQVLGLKLRERVQVNEELELAFLSYPGQPDIEVELIKGSNPESSDGIVNHLAFRVEAIEEELARLKGLGVEVLDSVPRAGRKGMKIAFFRGPNGEKLEMIEY